MMSSWGPRAELQLVYLKTLILILMAAKISFLSLSVLMILHLPFGFQPPL